MSVKLIGWEINLLVSVAKKIVDPLSEYKIKKS